jgi:hypothetical protein
MWALRLPHEGSLASVSGCASTPGTMTWSQCEVLCSTMLLPTWTVRRLVPHSSWPIDTEPSWVIRGSEGGFTTSSGSI